MPSIDTLRATLRKTPDDPSVLRLLADAAMGEFSFQEAKQAYVRLIALDENDADALLGLARVLVTEGNTSEALIRAEALSEKFPDFAQVFVFLSRLYLTEGDHSRARQLYERGLAIDPDVRDTTLEKDLAPSRSDEKRNESDSVDSALWNDLYEDGDDFFDEDDDDFLEFPMADGFDALLQEDTDAVDDKKVLIVSSECPVLGLDDIEGMERVKKEVRLKVLGPRESPGLFQPFGKGVAGGTLLFGPRGCGKLLASRAIAGETDAAFFHLSPGKVRELADSKPSGQYIDLFKTMCRDKTAVVYLSAFEVLCENVSSKKGDVVLALLAALCELAAADPRFVVLASSHSPWKIDAFSDLGSGFDNRIFVPPPDGSARKEIFSTLVRDKPHGDIDFDILVGKTEDFSSVDIRIVVDVAVDEALNQSMQKGTLVPVSNEMLIAAIASTPPSTTHWFDTMKMHNDLLALDGIFEDVMRYLNRR